MAGKPEAFLAALAVLFWTDLAPAQEFLATGFPLPGLAAGQAAWGDMDADRDLDLVLTGQMGGVPSTRVYRNTGSGFSQVLPNLPGTANGSAAWADVDKDGDSDLLLAGHTGSALMCRLYKNQGSSFVDSLVGLPGVNRGSVAWGDFDEDGDSDILLTGNTGTSYLSRIYRNSGNGFTAADHPLVGVHAGRGLWRDYDADGRLDILLVGSADTGFVTKVYRQVDTGFLDIEAPLAEVWNASADWKDCDGDSLLDIVLSGTSRSGNVTKVYRYKGGSFAEEGAVFPAPETPSVSWGDADGDGDQDILLSGLAGGEYLGRVYRNDGNAFVDIRAPLTGVAGVSAWGDYDADGKTDLLLAGNSGAGAVSRVFRNLGGALSPAGPPLAGAENASIQWGDYDADGDLDLVLTGTGTAGASSRLYRNDAGTFVDPGAALPGVAYGRGLFGDYDNDGDLDLLLCGNSGTSNVSRVFRNEAGNFLDAGFDLEGVAYGAGAWGDYDRDGDLDILVTGNTGNANVTRLYRNDGALFPLADSSLPGGLYGSAAWGDYDKDGDPDLLLTGLAGGAAFTRLFRNDKGTFADAEAGLAGVHSGSGEWGDFDSDGDLDLLVFGNPGAGNLSGQIYRNDGGTFVDIRAALGQLPSPGGGSAAWADYDEDGDLDVVLRNAGTLRICRNEFGFFSDIQLPALGWQSLSGMAWADLGGDGNLDLALAGRAQDGTRELRVFRMLIDRRNLPPGPPQALQAAIGKSAVSLSWGQGSDDRTARAGLGYNLYLRRLASGALKGAPMSLASGFRQLAAWGNAGQNSSQSLTGLDDGEYAWSVQAIDHGFAGSDFAPEGRFTLGVSPPSNLRGEAGNASVTLRWSPVEDRNFHRYLIYGGIDSAALAILDSTVAAKDTVKVLGGLVNDTLYHFRVVCADAGRNESPPSNRAAVRTDGSPPVAPRNLTAIPGDGTVSLRWSRNAEPDFQRYVIFQSRSSAGGVFVAVDSTWGAGDTDRTLTGLSNGDSYRFRVVGVDQVQNRGLPSDEAAAALSKLQTSSPALEFGSVLTGEQARLPLDLSFLSPREDTVRSLALDDAQFSLEGPSTFALEPGRKGHVEVVFRPGAPGSFAASLTITSTATANPTARIPLTAKGVTPVLQLSKTNLPFGQVRAQAARSDSLLVTNGGSGTLRLDSIRSDHPWFSPEPGSAPRTLLAGESFWLRVFFRPLEQSPELNQSLILHSNDLGGSRRIQVSGTGAVGSIVPVDPSCAFGTVRLLGARDTLIRIRNQGNASARVDSITFSHPAFSLLSELTSVPPQTTLWIGLRFSAQETGGGDYAGTAKIHFEGAYVEIGLSGRATGKPSCRISEIKPGIAYWDAGTDIAFLASANDSDDAGTGDRIRDYLWTSSGSGPLEPRTPGFLIKASTLGIGRHVIGLRVVDNEGDTSSACLDTVAVVSRRPLARIDSLFPSKLILHGGGDFRIHATAYDRDQFSDDAHDSLRQFGLYSTRQGLLSRSKDTALSSGALLFGSHGFYAMAVDDEGDSAFSDTVWIPVQAGLGHVLLAAGIAFDDFRYFINNVSSNCNWVYSKLLQKGFSHEQIHYFNPVGWQSIGDPFTDSKIVDVDSPTVDAFRRTLLGLRADVERGVPLLVVLLGHASSTLQQGRFYINRNEYLTPDSLDAWLGRYSVPKEINTPLVLMMDFGFAGSFPRKLLSASQNRILLTSASADRASYFVQGRSFSAILFQEIQMGKSVGDAWLAAQEWSRSAAPSVDASADPLAYVNPDLVPNHPALDLVPLKRVFVGGGGEYVPPAVRPDSASKIDPPLPKDSLRGDTTVTNPGGGKPPGDTLPKPKLDWEWQEVKLSQDFQTHSIAIRALVKDRKPLEKAWFQVVPPDYDPFRDGSKPLPGDSLTAEAEGYAGKYPLGKDIDPGDTLYFIFSGRGDNLQIPPLSLPFVVKEAEIPVSSQAPAPPLRFALSQNYPNPFRGSTNFQVSLTRPGTLTLEIRDLRGNVVYRKREGAALPGKHLLSWDGRTGKGEWAQAGLYWLSVHGAEGTLRRKMILAR